VWFLEAGGVERSCSIPFGKIVYVPVNFWFCLPEADGQSEGCYYLDFRARPFGASCPSAAL
jgi:hypothetical protein